MQHIILGTACSSLAFGPLNVIICLILLFLLRHCEPNDVPHKLIPGPWLRLGLHAYEYECDYLVITKQPRDIGSHPYVLVSIGILWPLSSDRGEIILERLQGV